jgi:predicted transposase YbfD/YdcC
LSAGDIDEKSNEIPLVRKLIEDFPFKEIIFKIDAMHTQFEIVKKIKESGNDVVVQIKKPEKTL